MKRKLIKQNCKDIFSGKISNEMIDSIEEMFDRFIGDKKSENIKEDLNIFFDEMYLDIECELESWD